MKRISATVSSGKNKGTVLQPHKYVQGHFLIAKGGNTMDCTRKVFDFSELEYWICRGFSVRMSAVGYPPSLIGPKRLKIEKS